MSASTESLAFSSPARNAVYSLAFIPAGESEPVSAGSGQTLSQVRARFPDVVVMAAGEAEALEENAYYQPWKEITEARWLDQLYVMPPADWVSNASGETFKSSERHYGKMTAIFACWQGRYFECRDRCTLRHSDLILSVARAFSGLADNRH